MQVVPTKAQVLQSIKYFLTEESTRTRPRQCRSCGLAMRLAEADFLLCGSAATWSISLPFCPACNREILRDVAQAETIH